MQQCNNAGARCAKAVFGGERRAGVGFCGQTQPTQCCQVCSVWPTQVFISILMSHIDVLTPPRDITERVGCKPVEGAAGLSLNSTRDPTPGDFSSICILISQLPEILPVEKWFLTYTFSHLNLPIHIHTCKIVHSGKWQNSESELFGAKIDCMGFGLVQFWTVQRLAELWPKIGQPAMRPFTFPFLVVQSLPARGSDCQHQKQQSRCGSPSRRLNSSSSSSQKDEL